MKQFSLTRLASEVFEHAHQITVLRFLRRARKPTFVGIAFMGFGGLGRNDLNLMASTLRPKNDNELQFTVVRFLGTRFNELAFNV